VHPSTLQLFYELGLLEALLARPHNKVESIGARIGGQSVEIVDFRHLPVAASFLALMPQWDFLDFVAAEARRYPTFRLVQACEAEALVENAGRVTGARMRSGNVISARLTIASDGRDSRFRSGLPAKIIGAPMDVFWFRIPKAPAIENDSMGVFEAGRIFVLIDRSEYWQCAFVFPKGTADAVREEGLDAFIARVIAVGPETARAAESLRSWDDVKLLTVTVDRLGRWHRPGLLVIGDAAHAMSPIGGVGINLAIQDAVAAANLLAAPMIAGADIDPLLHRVRDRRHRAVQLTQGMQRLVQDRLIAPMLARQDAIYGAPLAARLLDRVKLLRRIPARVIGLGFRPEHIRSPEAR
jgi:2-polyprenyl-6-methoxyphenol hydroxylase-like FAD-dependent oxidoreductase